MKGCRLSQQFLLCYGRHCCWWSAHATWHTFKQQQRTTTREWY
jgi:hypothetical protein